MIFSDGWERDQPGLAHRVVWVNPRKSAPGFASCDSFVCRHSVAALAEVIPAIAGSEVRDRRRSEIAGIVRSEEVDIKTEELAR